MQTLHCISSFGPFLTWRPPFESVSAVAPGEALLSFWATLHTFEAAFPNQWGLGYLARKNIHILGARFELFLLFLIIIVVLVESYACESQFGLKLLHHSFGLVLNDMDALPHRDDTAVEDLKKNGRISDYYVCFLKKLRLAIGYQRVRNGKDQFLHWIDFSPQWCCLNHCKLKGHSHV